MYLTAYHYHLPSHNITAACAKWYWKETEAEYVHYYDCCLLCIGLLALQRSDEEE